MNIWIRFFLGTPKRFLGTCAGLAILAAIIEPSLLQVVAERLMNAFGPLFGPLLQLAIVLFGFKVVFSGFCGRGKK